jgi:hypothetical protein
MAELSDDTFGVSKVHVHYSTHDLRKHESRYSVLSHGLKNHLGIGLRTKTSVQELAKELNHEPNQTAIYFQQNKTFTILAPKLIVHKEVQSFPATSQNKKPAQSANVRFSSSQSCLLSLGYS